MNKYFVIILILTLMACSLDVTKENEILELDFPDVLDMTRRADWGWVPIDTAFSVHEIEKITIHHGGVEYKEDENPVEYLKNLQSWSRIDKKWVDNPYHYMIDLDGVIYECRPINIPGDTNTDYDPNTHALICVMGNYEIQTLSDKQLQSIIKMCVYLVQKFDVPSTGIKSHKDYSRMTDCPGEDVYKYLTDGTIVNQVNKILAEE